MKFAGIIKNSFVDFPNNISTVVFTFGCNFNCWYCHNRQIIEGERTEPISEEEVFEFLKKRKGLIDGVVISGGEPTLCEGLETFIVKVKNLGFKVKLDTNGTNPTVLKNLLNKNLLDFVAMDIKTSFNNYPKLVGGCVNIEDVKKSINILINSKIDYEFRTTFSPDVSLENIEEIASYIKNAKSYAIQKYNSPNKNVVIIPHSKSDFDLALKIAKKYVKNCFLRSF